MKHLLCKLIGHHITGRAMVRGRGSIAYCSRCKRTLEE